MLTRRINDGNHRECFALRSHRLPLLIQIAGLALAASFTGSAMAQGPVLTLLPAIQNVGLGDTLQVSVGISGLTGPPSLGGYDVTVDFDPLFAFDNLTFGDPALGDQLDLEGYGTYTASNPSPGAIELTEISFDDPTVLDTTQARSFTMATLTFSALATGTGAFSFSNVLLSDSIGNSITPASLGTAQATVGTSTPEPSSFILVLMALAVLVFFCGARVRRLN